MPTRDTAWPAGTPCWVDYAASDLDAAQRFYADVLGWSYSGGDPEFGGYLSCQTKGLPAAGMAPLMDSSDSPAWTTYFATDDCDATVVTITEAGGTVVLAPMQVAALGRMAIALDPQGHPFGLWESGEHTGARIFNEPGSIVWNEAAVADLAAAQAFYTAVFGFRFDEIPDMGGYATFSTEPDHPLGGVGPRSDGVPMGWACCFSVASTDAAVDAVVRGGGTVLMPAEDTPFGRFAVVEDPWHAMFSVMEDTTSDQG